MIMSHLLFVLVLVVLVHYVNRDSACHGCTYLHLHVQYLPLSTTMNTTTSTTTTTTDYLLLLLGTVLRLTAYSLTYCLPTYTYLPTYVHLPLLPTLHKTTRPGPAPSPPPEPEVTRAESFL